MIFYERRAIMKAKRFLSMILAGTILGTTMPNMVFAIENNSSEKIEYIVKYNTQ